MRRRILVRAITVLMVALLSATPGLGQDFFFLQAADPQFGMYTDNRDFARETANFELVVDSANRLRPAFVVVCGDLLNKTGDAAQTAEYLRIAHKLNPAIPLYNVAGNHDVGDHPTRESLAAYRKDFGRDYYSFRHGNFEGFVVNSSLIQHPEHVLEEAATQTTWLKSELERPRANGVQWRVIFQHIPWFLERADEPEEYFNLPLDARGRFFELFQRAGIEYIFAGHYHRNAYGTGAGLHVITTGPVGKPLGTDPSGIRVVRVTASGIQSRYYGLAVLPNRLDGPLP